MINTKELRMDADDALAAHTPLEICGSELIELLDRLEAAEKGRDELRVAVCREADRADALNVEVFFLRARIEEMEKQSPACVTTKAYLAALENGGVRYIVGRDPVFTTRSENDVPLYLARGAKVTLTSED